jgi:hypothetical protein
MDVQAQCLFFTKLPPEIRNMIYMLYLLPIFHEIRYSGREVKRAFEERWARMPSRLSRTCNLRVKGGALDRGKKGVQHS